MKSHLRINRQIRSLQQLIKRRGGILVMSVAALVASIGFVALSVDLGVVSLTKTRMQNAVDASALAAAQEITAAIEESAQSGGGGDVNAIAVDAAKDMAFKVAGLNDTYIDINTDVRFGKRVYNTATGSFDIQWGQSPSNVVQVTARKTNSDMSAPDSKLSLFFSKFFGDGTASITASATAFVEARDIVVVLDYSGSMSFDSQFPAMSSSKLGKAPVEANFDDIWDTLVAENLTYSDTGRTKFPSTGFGDIDSYTGTYVSSSDYNTIYQTLRLDEMENGQYKYPFPQEGKFNSGNMKGEPDGSDHYNRWRDYFSFVKNDSDVNRYGYRKKYGYRTLIGYLIERKKRNRHSEDLWRAPIYPFHAMKEGMTLFTVFLDGLDFGDHIGLVTYDSTSRVETGLTDDGYPESVDLGTDLITDDHLAIDTIQRHKQAGHYEVFTGLGYGIKDGRDLLESHGRYGARPTLLVMTDGNANRSPSGWSLPGNWDWAELTDYDGDGSADYTTSNKNKQYAFYEAKQAIDRGYKIHTLTVGQGADRNLMEAIAFAGGGIWMDVPGGSTVQEMEQQMLDAFAQIAANVPPAKLANDN